MLQRVYYSTKNTTKKEMKNSLLVTIAWLVGTTIITANIYDVSTLGAKSDGATNNSQIIPKSDFDITTRN